ncbi:transposase [Streptomyces sp. NBC_00481]|uniref:IS110 family transposase n=1 Tax=Streptomyces sp. NBC_00481 TaxID=2975755 RepID=UPI002DD864E2|nr:transposase [Streptomyces sp. NBC_00481]WRY94013.1 transposase [Streptomyces sp. NBC_00481]
MEELREDHDDGTVARVAAIDIAKASGMVCLRVPHDAIEGRRVQQVWNVVSTTNAILELGDRLVCQGVEPVVMEATGSYWRPFFYLLEARGLDCWLVNARDVKNVPGRPKTDKLDAVWLAKLAERGMVRASFVPPKAVRQLRDFTRTRTVFVQERTRHKHRVDKALQDAQVKLSDVVSDLFGVSGRAMLNALVAGERTPRALADLAKGSLARKKAALIEALTGQFEDHHARLLRADVRHRTGHTSSHRTGRVHWSRFDHATMPSGPEWAVCGTILRRSFRRDWSFGSASMRPPSPLLRPWPQFRLAIYSDIQLGLLSIFFPVDL